MVLCSVEDGTALASLHVRAAAGPRRGSGQALIAMQPDDPALFHGILNVDGQAFELVMTNLTTDGVLMMDIGGEQRHQEPEFWGRTDKSFWSRRHRNDQRLNRSNILWPMAPNVCDDSFLHFQETGVSRQLQLLARQSGAAGGEGAAEVTYPIFVYPKFGSRAAERFERTAWCCPETLVVVGTPALLGGGGEDYNIQIEQPLSRMAGGGGGAAPGEAAASGSPEAAVAAVAGAFGISSDRLLELMQVDRAFLSGLPPELQHEVLMQQLDSVDLPKLLEREDEAAGREPPAPVALGPASGPVGAGGLAAGSAPADVVAGGRVLRASSGSRLLIERFHFDRPSPPARLRFAVHERLQLAAEAEGGGEASAALAEEARRRVEALSSGRREALMERICSVYANPECAICLVGDPKPDAVLYQCGHRCVHMRCVERARLQRCPLCRAPIVAILPVDPDAASVSL